MIRFAKREYFNLKLWYYNLTNVFKMKVAVYSLSSLLLFGIGYVGTLQYKIFTTNTELQNKTNEITLLNDYAETQHSVIDYQSTQNENIKEFVNFIINQRPVFNALTGYHPVVEQCDATPDVTADGTKFDIDRAGDYRYVALSRDQLKRWGGKIKFKDFVLITGTPNNAQDGIYQVRDTMNKRHTEWIDILLTPGQKSFYHRKVMMYKIPKKIYFAIEDGIKEFYDVLPMLEPLALLSPEI